MLLRVSEESAAVWTDCLKLNFSYELIWRFPLGSRNINQQPMWRSFWAAYCNETRFLHDSGCAVIAFLYAAVLLEMLRSCSLHDSNFTKHCQINSHITACNGCHVSSGNACLSTFAHFFTTGIAHFTLWMWTVCSIIANCTMYVFIKSKFESHSLVCVYVASNKKKCYFIFTFFQTSCLGKTQPFEVIHAEVDFTLWNAQNGVALFK